MRYLLLIVMLGWTASMALAGDLPARIEIDFALNGSIGKGKAHETIIIQQEQNNRQYAIQSEISASGFLRLIKPGSIVRASHGKINQAGLQPMRFTDQRGKKAAREVEFDWDGQRIVYRRKGKQMETSLPAGALDKLSLPYHFMFAPLPEAEVTLHETDHRRLQSARYRVSREMLETPMGTLATIVLTKQQAADDPFRKQIWLAIDHHLLPVRIVSTEKGGLEVDQIVTHIHYRDEDDGR
ncbi:DUF3108 domain-containing protein [Nitrosomonas halophila]|uniref:DUF3108 domain-containing protein n=1 Tax=Nitrosomonas halophila TaxID=44576 RepID=A0A1H3EF72_9PROT|nr:DUF3108 domain-containing protein [Nitrosomonas halophila]SDX77270.1 Protein of unknown function [Nitrosomonas halophila]